MDKDIEIVDREGENEEHQEEEVEVNIEDLNERMEQIMKKLESLDVDREVGEKEQNSDTRVIIEKIELENFKSYAEVKKIGPLHHVYYNI